IRHKIINNSFINFYFFFSSRRRHTRSTRDWSSDVCSSDLVSDDAETAQQCTRARWKAPFYTVSTSMVRLFSEDVRGFCVGSITRSEERRVGKECRYWWSGYHLIK